MCWDIETPAEVHKLPHKSQTTERIFFEKFQQPQKNRIDSFIVIHITHTHTQTHPVQSARSFSVMVKPSRKLVVAPLLGIMTATTNIKAVQAARPRRHNHHHLHERVRKKRKRARSLQGTFELTAFGEDLNRSDPRAPLTSYPNAEAAKAEFWALFANIETESFEDFPLNMRFPLETEVFQSAGRAIITGADSAKVSETGANPHLRHATDGKQFLDVNANDDFFMSFDQLIVR